MEPVSRKAYEMADEEGGLGPLTDDFKPVGREIFKS
jgi:hypothetical protein